MSAERDPFSPIETGEGDIISRADQLSTDGILMLFDEAEDEPKSQNEAKTLDSITTAAQRIIHAPVVRPPLSDAEITMKYEQMLVKAEKLDDEGMNPRLADPDGEIRRAYEALEERRRQADEAESARVARQAIETMRIARQEQALAEIRARTSPADLEKAKIEYIARERARRERNARLA